jgi:hypothetical protein
LSPNEASLGVEVGMNVTADDLNSHGADVLVGVVLQRLQTGRRAISFSGRQVLSLQRSQARA